MPQPLSGLLKKGAGWSVTFGPNQLQKQPSLSAKIGEAIAAAAAMDHGMATILVQVLHASPEPAFAMFSEVMDAGNKRSMILAAARSSLSPDDFESLEAISSVFRAQMDIRNRFAHWLWGSCEQVKDGLLLADPRYMLSHTRQSQLEWQKTETQRPWTSEQHDRLMAAMRFDFDQIYVYRESDFDQVLRDMAETLSMINTLCFILSPSAESLEKTLTGFDPGNPAHNLTSQARQRLSSLRLFSEALSRLRSKRQKS